jgi:sugar lactone lactonase YvrE
VPAFDRDSTGNLARRRVWADLHDLRPDGMCLDAEGALWAAGIDACAAARVIEGGRITHRPYPRP